MHVIVTYVFTMGLMMLTLLTIGRDMLVTFDSVADAWRGLQTRTEAMQQARIAGPVGLSVDATSTVQITVTNEGDAALGRFKEWDLIVETQQSPGLGISYLSYTTSTSPSANQWTVEGIYLDASSDPKKSEIVGPGSLDPGEAMIVVANPSPGVKADTYDRATFVTPNGLGAEVIFHVLP